MSEVEIYRAMSGRAAAPRSAKGAAPFTIEVQFLGGLSAGQKQAFKAAADRWTRAIVGDLPPVTIGGDLIDDLLILAKGESIDGPGSILGQAGPTHLRPASAGASAFLPAKGEMTFDSDDLDDMEANGTLNDVIAHEMGHVLGIGTIWRKKGLLNGAGTTNPTFAGANAAREYGILAGAGVPKEVPVENSGGPGTREGHWRESVFRHELMTGYVGNAGNPLCAMTIAALQDMGYVVDLGAAEPYAMPDHLAMAESGALVARALVEQRGVVLPIIPITLPEGSLQ